VLSREADARRHADGGDSGEENKVRRLSSAEDPAGLE
jgi:hypothetical protein